VAEPELIDVDAASRMVALGRSKVAALCREGAIPSIHVGRRVLIPVAGLREWVAQQVETTAKVRASGAGDEANRVALPSTAGASSDPENPAEPEPNQG
jgi:excisionase family DNA binding protein